MQMDDESSADDEAWFHSWRGVLFTSARVLRMADSDMVQHDGFPLTWFDVLSRLADAGPAGLRMQELEEVALFTRSGLTRLVDRIEAAGLVRREPVPGDRRGVRVVLTAAGRQRYVAAIARHRELIEREFGRRLTPAQHQSIAEALWPWWHEADPAD
ncbi:MAG TPA: MarR family transcriptional regulator [Candidatus Limnocylindrales bacterium]|jgi:DNA-binding MarR family transcriptional regulator|nr:MarR family transcriptional regulator [Candidatus Limnocylindrales bacterium]